MKTYIIGSGYLSSEIKKKFSSCYIYSASNFLNIIDEINKISLNSKVNLIINSFYSVKELNKIKSYNFFFKKSITEISSILDKINYKIINKIIYTSSSSVYGSIDNKIELDDPNNRYIYSSLKLTSETLFKNYCNKHNIKLDICRVFNIYGNKDNFSIISKLISKKKNKKIKVNNNGLSIRDFIHVKDVVNIYKKLLRIKNSGYYDLGTGKGVKIIDIINSLKINKKYLIFSKKKTNEIQESIADTTSLKKEIKRYKFNRLENFLKVRKLSFKRKNNNNYLENNLIGSIIYGAGYSGLKLAAQLSNFDKNNVSYLVDDNVKKIGSIQNNIEVISFEDLKNLSKRTKIRNIIIAIPSLKQNEKVKLIKKLIPICSSISSLPEKNYFKDKSIEVDDINEISLEELFDQKNLVFRESSLNKFNNQTILVTGGAGSIGSELCRQLNRSNFKKMIILDHSEFNIYRLSQTLSGKKIKLVLGDIKDQNLISKIIINEKVNFVFHAAAYKHVKFLEKNIIGAVKNNILGTLAVLKSLESKKINFIFISTDKAVNPKTILGITKRASEMIINHYSTKKFYEKCNFSVVRFGNVIGSDGSALPYFLNQIKKDLPILLTDKKMERYFMTIKEACSLVLQSCSINTKNKILFLDMGKPVKILNVIKKIFQTYKKPYQKLKIKIMGNKYNEKLSEKLTYRKKIKKTQIKKIFSIEDPLPKKNYDIILQKLQKNIDNQSNNSLMKILTNLIK